MKSVVSVVAVATALASGVSAFVTPSSRTASTDASQLSLPPADERHIPVDSTRASYYPFGASISSDRSISLSARPPKSNEEVTDGSADVRQLLGLKGASETTDIWKIRLQLTKPVTWIPLVWGVMCGAAASGNYHWIWNPFDPNDRDVMLGLEDTAKGFVAMILAGPFLTGYTQTINDWYDREIDAINEPYRPIPSGAISEGQGVYLHGSCLWNLETIRSSSDLLYCKVIAQIWFLLLGGLGIAYGLDVWAGHDVPTVLLLSIFGSFISYIYSAPPLKLKQNGWAGNVSRANR